ncbi:hypothetical protein M758_UG174800 [Ceratodon purpureus]|nr:hypothetical protein M758_UG174800 [Ceratodon purpureus]
MQFGGVGGCARGDDRSGGECGRGAESCLILGSLGRRVLLVQSSPGIECLIPWVEDVVKEVDSAGRRVFIKPLEGLLELAKRPELLRKIRIALEEFSSHTEGQKEPHMPTWHQLQAAGVSRDDSGEWEDRGAICRIFRSWSQQGGRRLFVCPMHFPCSSVIKDDVEYLRFKIKTHPAAGRIRF